MAIESLKALGLRAEEERHFEEALNLYRLAVAHAEENSEYRSVPPLLVRIGLILLHLKDVDQAVTQFKQAGHVYAAHGMIQEVRTIARLVRKARPENLSVINEWKRTLVECGYGDRVESLSEPETPENPAAAADLTSGSAADHPGGGSPVSEAETVELVAEPGTSAGPSEWVELGVDPGTSAGPSEWVELGVDPGTSAGPSEWVELGVDPGPSAGPSEWAQERPDDPVFDWPPETSPGPLHEKPGHPRPSRSHGDGRPSFLMPEPSMRDTPEAPVPDPAVRTTPGAARTPELVWRRRRPHRIEGWIKIAIWTTGVVAIAAALLQFL